MNLERWLVDDWRAGKKWWTTYTCLGGITFNVLAACLVKGITIAVAFLGFVPLIWLPLIGLLISLITLAGRYAKQPVPRKENDDGDYGC